MENTKNHYSIEDSLLLKGKMSSLMKEKLRLSYEEIEKSIMKEKPTISQKSQEIAKARKDNWSISCSHEFRCLEKSLAKPKNEKKRSGVGSALYQLFNSSVDLKQAKSYKRIIDRRKHNSQYQ